MTSTDIIKALRISDIDMNNIMIGTKKTNKTVPISINGKPLVFQTPFLEVIGSLRKTQYPTIYHLDTLFKGDTKPKIGQWYQFMDNLETHISNLIVNNVTWFTQNDVNIKSLIREDENNSDRIYIKWPIDLKTNIFIGEDKKLFDPINLKEKDCIKLIVEIAYLWITENNCGLAAIVQKIMVKPFIEKIHSEYVFDDSDKCESDIDDNENNIISLLATEQKTRPTPKQNIQQQPNKKIQKPQKPITFTTNDKQINKETKRTDKIHQNIINNTRNAHTKINKDAVNPFKNIKYNNKYQNNLSDLSDDNSNGYSGKNMVQQLINDYSPSSNEDEINEDDLDMD
jgi:hypothetical protein